MIRNSIIALALLISVFSYSQEKKNPDYFDGFRDFKFFDLITDHYNYDHEIITYSNGYSYHKFILPEFERNFLNTEILEIRVNEYKSKIYNIRLVLKDDVEDIIEKMFEDTPIPKNQNDDSYSYFIKDRRSMLYDVRNYPRCSDKYEKPRTLEVPDPKIDFFGMDTDISYGNIDLVERTFDEDLMNLCSFSRYRIFDKKIKTVKYFLEFSANDYKEKIDSKMVAEHYDSYLNDFGMESTQIISKKDEYIIPLFEIGNSYYVKVQFKNKISEDMIST